MEPRGSVRRATGNGNEFANPPGGGKFPAMAFFKRIEVWILLVLSVAGVAWVLWSDEERKRAEREESDPAGEIRTAVDLEGARFEIRERRISREQDHFILTLRVGHRLSETGKRLFLASGASESIEPSAKLVTGAGDSVLPFFLPFDPPPVLDADPGAFLDLRFWLPEAQSGAALWLEFEGDRLAVKSDRASGFSADQFPEGIEVAVTGPDWTPLPTAAP